MANEIKVEISAKFEEGGAPSIKTIVKEIDNVYKTPSQEEKKVIDILKILGIINANTHLSLHIFLHMLLKLLFALIKVFP